MLCPIIATSLSPSLSKSPQETEPLESPKKGSSFLVTVIELFRSVTVLESVKVFVALIDSLGVIIIVSSSSSFKLSSIPVNVTVPLVEPGGILI